MGCNCFQIRKILTGNEDSKKIGWICAKCKKSYSPYVKECTKCSLESIENNDNDGTKIEHIMEGNI